MRIKNILISQVAPQDIEKTPYADLKKKYSINLDFFKFFKTDTISSLDFRKNKVNILDYNAVFFTSTTTIDHFFSLVKEMRITLPEATKYFCITDSAAHYLQKHIAYRKRKIFHPKNNNTASLFTLLNKHKELKFLVPSGADSIKSQFIEHFEKNGFDFAQATVFSTSAADNLKELEASKYDMIVIFSPVGAQVFKETFPDFDYTNVVFGALGTSAIEAIQNENWNLPVMAPTKEHTSITSAMDVFLKEHATRRR